MYDHGELIHKKQYSSLAFQPHTGRFPNRLRNVAKGHLVLSRHIAEIVLPAPSSSRLMSGLPGSAIGDLKLVQGAAARILTRTSEHSHTTLVLAFLLLIQTRADSKTLLLT